MKKGIKKRGGLAVRRANYTHRRKGVFNGESIEDSLYAGNVWYRTTTKIIAKQTLKNVKRLLFEREPIVYLPREITVTGSPGGGVNLNSFRMIV